MIVAAVIVVVFIFVFAICNWHCNDRSPDCNSCSFLFLRSAICAAMTGLSREDKISVVDGVVEVLVVAVILVVVI